MKAKRLFEILAIVLIALVIGAGSAVWVIDSFAKVQTIKDGAWTTHPLIGSVQANMYLRATIARIALFALSRTEAIYYNAFTDEEGEPLRPECDYIIEGGDLPARWWSVTAYDKDHFLIPNALNRYSYNMKNLRGDGQGRYKIYLSQTPKDLNWLPAAQQGTISITLRAYNPAQALAENMGSAELPRIMKVRCE